MLKRLLRLSVIVLSFLKLATAFATPVDQIVIFGDSISDNGNLYSLTSKFHKVIPLVPVIPKNPPYYEGRFTNGFNWVDDMSMTMQVSLDDYAYGGSWAEPLKDSKINIPFGLDIQVADYLIRHSGDANIPNHLFIIWSGANDYVHGRPDPDYATTNTVATIKAQIDWLLSYGAKNILVVGVPDLSVVPEVQAEGADAMQAIHEISMMHNEKLVAMMKAEQDANPSDKLMVLDITREFNDLLTNPYKYNIKNTLDACYTGGFYRNRGIKADELAAAKKIKLDIENNPSLMVAYQNGNLAAAGDIFCTNPDEYVFWDVIHPTRYVHQLIAQEALKFLASNGIEFSAVTHG